MLMELLPLGLRAKANAVILFGLDGGSDRDAEALNREHDCALFSQRMLTQMIIRRRWTWSLMNSSFRCVLAASAYPGSDCQARI